MNSSLVTADRPTHVKIVLVALVAAILVVMIGITARVTSRQQAGIAIRPAGSAQQVAEPSRAG